MIFQQIYVAILWFLVYLTVGYTLLFGCKGLDHLHYEIATLWQGGLKNRPWLKRLGFPPDDFIAWVPQPTSWHELSPWLVLFWPVVIPWLTVQFFIRIVVLVGLGTTLIVLVLLRKITNLILPKVGGENAQGSKEFLHGLPARLWGFGRTLLEQFRNSGIIRKDRLKSFWNSLPNRLKSFFFILVGLNFVIAFIIFTIFSYRVYTGGYQQLSIPLLITWISLLILWFFWLISQFIQTIQNNRKNREAKITLSTLGNINSVRPPQQSKWQEYWQKIQKPLTIIWILIVMLLGSLVSYSTLPERIELLGKCVPKEIPWELSGRLRINDSKSNPLVNVNANNFVDINVGDHLTGTIRIENRLKEPIYVNSLTLRGPFGFGDSFFPNLDQTYVISPTIIFPKGFTQSGDDFILSLPLSPGTGTDCGMLLDPGGENEIQFSFTALTESRLYGDFVATATPWPKTSWFFEAFVKPNLNEFVEKGYSILITNP